MTVCIAARSGGFIVIATDRMITSGDVLYEPPNPKVTFVTSSIAVMFAGDAAFHSEVFREVYNEVQYRVAAAPDEWLQVADVAEMYLRHRDVIRRTRAERAVLVPLGLTLQTFLGLQSTMEPSLVKALAADLLQYRVPSVSVIVAGIEPAGDDGTVPRIMTIYDGEMVGDAPVGFSTIGNGHRHAASQFMLGRHAWHSPFTETLLLTYTAKKAAEIAPGVGSATDFYIVGSGLGRWTAVADSYLAKFDSLYRKAKAQEASARKRANTELTRYLDAMLAQSAQAQNDSSDPNATRGGDLPSPD